MKNIFVLILILIASTSYSQQGWVYMNFSTSEEFDNIIFKNQSTGFLMGWSQNIYKTTNTGLSWTKTTFGNVNTRLGAMAYAGSNTWYLSDYFNPVIYKTTNDGQTWDSSNPGFSGFTALQFINENTGFGVFKYFSFAKTTNGGLNWFIKDSIGSQNWTVNFIDENTGYVGGGGRLRKTTNGGITFDTIPRSIIYGAWDVKFISRDTIIVSGETYLEQNVRTIWKSIDGGQNWTAKYLSPGTLVGPLRFPTAHTGYVHDQNGSIFKTTNSGNSWIEIEGVNNGIGMNFINSETGFVVGYNGLIAKTTNGGGPVFINSNESIPKSFSLYQNYPNPFNPSTKIKFDLPKNENVKIIIFDILGRQMETLLDENLIAGIHEVNWNASRYAAGVYFYMLLTEGIKETKKMILIK